MITVRKLTNFWETLDMLTDMGMPAISWRGGHPGEWEVVRPLLVNTGRRAASVDCPSGAGEFCPRKVIELSGGRMIAECQDIPAVCDTLEVTLADIQMQRVDRAKFAAMICDTLNLTPAQQKPLPGGLFAIGSRGVVAGRSVTVFGLFQGGSQPERGLAVFDLLQEVAQPQLLLVPTAHTLSEDQKRHLARIGTEYRALDDALLADDAHNVCAAAVVTDLLAKMENAISQSLQSPASELLWQLPPDATWPKMKIVFQSDEVINITYGGDTKRFEPAQLGMTKANSGKPTNQWVMLKAIAIGRGTIPFPSEAKLQKQKQALSKKLIAAFGIKDDPIEVRDGSYVALYVTNADGLKQGRQGAHQRNFVDDD
ncbi:hypothetical protein FHS51_003447 [Sphingobium wenxiniae]|uniref:Uncharacterized protein n=2 Tax=Sphingobium TaxID=165695 RepID=T0GEK7_9SPHN|nr:MULTISPECIES: hypothetical protein [Sphingobium]EQA99106.1 hypothetical protein L485_16275 [Sphingobium baderi LL03]KMS61595.1 hypothetical protein V475_14170 [Sphingobium baderi LL03]MBB6193191.1 hypothetical protein [Sphingobium wenxiniae]TWH96750.1 hypothetical protein IQ35_00681 [Sphingobium wenxiniae]